MVNGIALGVHAAYGSFAARREQGPPVRRIGQRQDAAVVAAHDPDHSAKGGLPDPHRSVVAGGGAKSTAFAQ